MKEVIRIYFRSVLATLLVLVSCDLNAQESDFNMASIYRKAGNHDKALKYVNDALSKAIDKFGVYSLEFELGLHQAIPFYYSAGKIDEAHSIIEARLEFWEDFEQKLLDNNQETPEKYASFLSGEYQSIAYLCANCSDTTFALQTYRKNIEPYQRKDIHNIDYADALFYTGTQEFSLGEDYSRLKELQLYELAVNEYASLNVSDSLLINRLRYISGCVGAILGSRKLDQMNGSTEAFNNACECIEIWKRCLTSFHESLGKDRVDSLLTAQAKNNLDEWSSQHPVYEYAYKMHIMEPYWESQNQFATELSLIGFLIRDGQISRATAYLDDVIHNLSGYGLLSQERSFIFNMNVSYIRSLADDNPAKALEELNSWYGESNYYHKMTSSQISSEMTYYVAKELYQSGYFLEAQDLFESLYINGHSEREINGINPYDDACQYLFSLSPLHYEDTRRRLAEIKDRYNSIFWDSPIATELRNANKSDYRNLYNYINDRIILGDICVLDKRYNDALDLLLSLEEDLPNTDPLAVESRYEQFIQPVLFNRIGQIYYTINDLDNALKFLDRASQLNYIPAKINMGNIYYSLGDFQKAITHLEIGREYFGVNLTELLQMAYAAIGDKEKANEVGYELFNSKRDEDIKTLFKMFATERKMYPFGHPYGAYYVQYPEIFGGLCYDAYLYSKSITLHSEQTIRNAIISQGQEGINQYNAIINGNAHEEYARDYATLLREYYDSIFQYIQKTGGIKEYFITWQDVQSTLKKGDIAIEFFLYNDLGDIINDKYAAVIIKDSGRPIIVKLPGGDEIREFINKADKGYRQKEISSRFFNRIMENILPFMKKGKNVYFSPDGLLHQLNIEGMYTSDAKNAKLACEVYKLKRLSSTRELCITNNIPKDNNAVIYGDLQYDMSDAQMILAHSSYVASDYSNDESCEIVRGLGGQLRDLATPLESTKVEIDEISALLNANKIENEVISGKDGTEESFKALSGHAPRIIHFATHGFYCEENLASRESFYEFQSDTDYFMQNPMNRSGVLLSGAKKALQGSPVANVEDGVLLASEIASMDLSNTDLVVLSACKTGVGDMSMGEVYGLQRGFKLAGVQTIIMSLWDVPDENTATFMMTFYKYLLSGNSKTDAFSKARTKMYKNDPARSDCWAAFIMLD